MQHQSSHEDIATTRASARVSEKEFSFDDDVNISPEVSRRRGAGDSTHAEMSSICATDDGAVRTLAFRGESFIGIAGSCSLLWLHFLGSTIGRYAVTWT